VIGVPASLRFAIPDCEEKSMNKNGEMIQLDLQSSSGGVFVLIVDYEAKTVSLIELRSTGIFVVAVRPYTN
jgi:hypothetical protein